MLQQIRPALILLDLNLPGINGIEVYDRLQADPQMQAIPVMFVTANPTAPALVARKFPHVIAKPFEIDVLLGRIAELLPLAAPTE